MLRLPAYPQVSKARSEGNELMMNQPGECGLQKKRHKWLGIITAITV